MEAHIKEIPRITLLYTHCIFLIKKKLKKRKGTNAKNEYI